MKRVWPLLYKNRQHGMSVVEVLLAVTIFGMLATALIGTLVYGRMSTAGGGDRARANYLAEEGIEATRNINAAAFSNLTDSAAAVGNTNIETGSDSNANGTSAYKVATGTASGAVTSVSVYVRTVDAVNSNVQMAIYSDSSGVPGTLLGASAIQSVTSTGWNVFPISGVTVTASTNYWIGLSENGNTVFASNIGSGGNATYDLTSAYPAPSTFSVNDTQLDKMSFYMSVGSTYGLSKSSNIWAFSGTSDVTDIYSRKITVTGTSTNRKLITSTVTWTDNTGNTDQTSVVSLLSNWRATIVPPTSWANATQPGATGQFTATAGVKVATVGNYAYYILNTSTNNLLTVDISNAAAPSIVNTVNLGVTPTSISANNGYLYITSSTATSCLKVYSIATPTAPASVKTVSATGTAACNDVYASGTKAYVVRASSTTTGSNEFNVVDITTPASAAIVGGYNSDFATNAVWASGNYAYIARTATTTNPEVLVINVSTPTAPTLAGNYNPANTNTAKTITGIGNTLFVGYGTTINSVNITTPATPVSLGTFTASGTVNDLDVDSVNNILFDATSNTGSAFQVINVATPASMSLIKALSAASIYSLSGVAYNGTLDRAVGVGGSSTQQLFTFIKN